MKAKLQNPGLIFQTNFILFTVLFLAVLWVVFPGWPGTIALWGIGVLFLFGLKKPVWALAAFMASQFTLTSYIISLGGVEISLRLLLLVAIGIVFLAARTKRGFDLGPNAKQILIPVVLLIVITLVSNFVYSGFDYAFKDFRNMMVGLLIVILIPAVTGNVRQLRTLTMVVLIIISASAIVGTMQHFSLLGAENQTLYWQFLGTWKENPRIPGMAETELELSYTLSAIIPVLLGLLIAKGIKGSGNKTLIIISLIIMGVSLYFTFTRSALFALLIAVIAIAVLFNTRINSGVFLVITLVAIIVIESTGVLEGQYLSGRTEDAQTESTVARKILWQAGLAIAMDNPVLGIGGGNYQTTATGYEGDVDPDLLNYEKTQYWGYQTLGTDEIHNDFLNVWVSYGTLALVLYVWLFIVMLRNYLFAFRRSKNRFVKGLAIGLAAALFAYATNAFYHNVLATLSFFWILAGLSLVVVKLAAKRKEPAKEMTRI